MTALTDTHCHLSHCSLGHRALLDTASAAGVVRVVDVGMGLDESRLVVARAADDDRIRAAVGLHPNDLSDWRAGAGEAMDELRSLAASEAVVAVGETGIDTYRDREPADVQEAAFRAHIELARELDKAIVVHCRDAHDRVMRVLDDAGAPGRVVMHCFSGDAAYARACAERGWFCSFAGNITYSRSEDLREAARALPPDLLLVETDAPYLAPVPRRGKPNEPALVAFTAEALAGIRGEEPGSLRDRLAANVAAAFGIAP